MDKKHLTITLIIFIIIIIIGIITINSLFKMYWHIPFFEAEWSAGDALSFFGSIIGSIISLIGVFFTVKYAQENFKQDTINKSLPFISIDVLNKYNSKNVLDIFFEGNFIENEEESEEKKYIEERLSKIYFIIENGKIKSVSKLNSDLKKLIENRGFLFKEVSKGTYEMTSQQMLNLPIEIENVGNGAAINFRMGLNRNKEEKKYLKSQTLKVNDTLYICIIFPNVNDKDIGEYELDFHFSDIFGNEYTQSHNIKIDNSEENIYISIDFSTNSNIKK